MSVTFRSVEVLGVRLPFRFSFGHALATRRSSTNLFVKVALSDGTTGFGEGVPREYVTGETIDQGVELLRKSDLAAQLDTCRDFAAATALEDCTRMCDAGMRSAEYASAMIGAVFSRA